jgi:hypothetical protein
MCIFFVYKGQGVVSAEHHIGRYVIGMSSTQYFYNTWANERSEEGAWSARGYTSIKKNYGVINKLNIYY